MILFDKISKYLLLCCCLFFVKFADNIAQKHRKIQLIKEKVDFL